MDQMPCKHAKLEIEDLGTAGMPDKRPFVVCLRAAAMRPADRAGNAARLGAAGCKVFMVLNTARCPIAQAGLGQWHQCHLKEQG